MADYRLTNGTRVMRARDGASIPADVNNTDYKAFLAWAATNTPDPAPGATAQERADAALKEQTDGDVSGIKGNAKFDALVKMTPTQIAAHVATNVSTLDDIKDLVATLAAAVSVLARRL